MLDNPLVKTFAATGKHKPKGNFLDDLRNCVLICQQNGARVIVYCTPQEPEHGERWIQQHVELIRQASVGAEILDLSKECPRIEFAYDGGDILTSHMTPEGRARVKERILAATK